MHKQSQTIHLHFHHRGQDSKSLDNYKQTKLYSHIADEYNFRIGNKLMVQKIINPRRDKTIMDSLIQASPKFILRKKIIIPKYMRMGDNRRNQTNFQNMKKTDKHTQQSFEVQQIRNQCDKKQKSRVLRSIDQANSIRSQIKQPKQSLREEVFNQSIETRDCSLRNNFLGKIVKNQKRQVKKYDQTLLNSKLDINFNSEVAQSQILGDSLINESVNRSTKQQYTSFKHKFIKQKKKSNIKTLGHFREFSGQNLKENKQSYHFLGGNFLS